MPASEKVARLGMLADHTAGSCHDQCSEAHETDLADTLAARAGDVYGTLLRGAKVDMCAAPTQRRSECREPALGARRDQKGSEACSARGAGENLTKRHARGVRVQLARGPEAIPGHPPGRASGMR